MTEGKAVVDGRLKSDLTEGRCLQTVELLNNSEKPTGSRRIYKRKKHPNTAAEEAIQTLDDRKFKIIE